MFLVKGGLKISSKFTGENPCWNVISTKLQSNFIEITLRQGCSPVNFQNTFFIEHLWMAAPEFSQCLFLVFSCHEESSRFPTIYTELNVTQVKVVSTPLIPVETGRKFNVHKTFRRRPGRLLNVLCTLNLRPVSMGIVLHFLTLFAVPLKC